MSSYFSSIVSSIGNSIYSLLPQNEHSKQAAQLESHLLELQTALNDKTSDAFNRVLIDTSAQLKTEKTKCERQLQRLNGSFFQDPKSSLKKAWDTLSNEIFNALGTSIQNRSELEPISQQLQDENFTKAKSAIQIYK